MKLIIVDASYYFYRAFYGSPEDPKGGIGSMMQSALDCHKPDSVIVALDAGKQTFRSDLFAGYKANRPPSPEGFGAAVVSMKEAFSELGMESVAVAGYEADDIAGTLCAVHSSDEVVLMTKDKDWMQLVSDGRVSMWHDGAWVREAEVIAKFGVAPGLVVDVLGLSGDSGDGIPGVPGIGAKIASTLVQTFGALETVYENLLAIGKFRGGPRISATLRQSKDLAFLSRTLATIKTDLDLQEVSS